MHTFHPKTYLSRKDITQIRPMAYLPEKRVVHMVNSLNLPIVKSPCPANGVTKREDMKKLLDHIETTIPNVRELMLSALQNEAQYGLWEKR